MLLILYSENDLRKDEFRVFRYEIYVNTAFSLTTKEVIHTYSDVT